MRETNEARVSEAIRQGAATEDANQVVLRIIQSCANDNMMPTTRWFAWLIFWTIFVGAVLAYVIF